jgi:hypothetical protein
MCYTLCKNSYKLYLIFFITATITKCYNVKPMAAGKYGPSVTPKFLSTFIYYTNQMHHIKHSSADVCILGLTFCQPSSTVFGSTGFFFSILPISSVYFKDTLV